MPTLHAPRILQLPGERLHEPLLGPPVREGDVPTVLGEPTGDLGADGDPPADAGDQHDRTLSGYASISEVVVSAVAGFVVAAFAVAATRRATDTP